MIIHEGKKYTDKELADIAGVSEKAIYGRRAAHPEWGFDELIQPRSTTRERKSKPGEITFTDFSGKKAGLRKTAKRFFYSERFLYTLHDRGIRTWKQIQQHQKNHIPENTSRRVPIDFSAINIEDVKFYERFSHGQDDSARIVCELCGIHGMYAEEFREYFQEVFG